MRDRQRLQARDQYIDFLKRYNATIKAKYDAAGINIEQERYWSQADLRSPRFANNKAIRERLRSRSRYECRESNSYAVGMLLTKVNDVIGTGPRLECQTGDRQLDRAIEEQWHKWSCDINLPRKLRTLQAAKMGDGEGFAQRSTNTRSLNRNQVDVLVTEADLWTDPSDDSSDPTYNDGISFDEFGNPTAYKRLRQHPGDDLLVNDPYKTDSFDAEDVIHWYRQDRPGQCRGIPEFTPALPLFAELRRYRLAVISAAEIAANFAGVMWSDAPAFGDEPVMMPEDFMTINLERRAMLTLPHGWKMSQLKAEQPTTEFNQFTEAILAEIGRVSCMPLNIVAGTSREYNFASGRLDYLLYWSHCDVERSDASHCILDRIFSWWLDEALLIPGYLPRFGSMDGIPHRWVFPPRRPIDELNAAKADEVRWNMGHLTDEQWANREQIDIDRHYEQLGRMIEERTRLEAPLPANSNQQQQPQEQEPQSNAQKPNSTRQTQRA